LLALCILWRVNSPVYCVLIPFELRVPGAGVDDPLHCGGGGGGRVGGGVGPGSRGTHARGRVSGVVAGTVREGAGCRGAHGAVCGVRVAVDIVSVHRPAAPTDAIVGHFAVVLK
jgi:hypothetical protein